MTLNDEILNDESTVDPNPDETGDGNFVDETKAEDVSVDETQAPSGNESDIQSDELQANGQSESEIDAQADGGNVAVKGRRSKAEIAVNVALWIAIAVLLIAVVLRLFVFSSVAVDGDSMNPTYQNGDVVTVNKAIVPKRGDVIVFYKNEVDNKFTAQFAPKEECALGKPYEKLIKRVVALEGDKIWVSRVTNSGSDVMYEVVVDTADGERLYENYYVKKGETLPIENYYLHSDAGYTHLGNLRECVEDNPFVVSEGCFFAMGDNRTNSNDSRALGEFKLTQVFGVVLDK